jgi:hypothetical protein
MHAGVLKIVGGRLPIQCSSCTPVKGTQSIRRISMTSFTASRAAVHPVFEANVDKTPALATGRGRRRFREIDYSVVTIVAVGPVGTLSLQA